MAWGLVLAGVSAAAGAFNAYDEYHANRVIRRDLERIKEYLIGIRATTLEIQRQNEEILDKLDMLPIEIRQIVVEVVDTRFLLSRYSEIKTIRDTFLTLRGGRAYGIRSQEWLMFNSAMGYLFDHENRISKVFDLIDVCETALVISKERASPIVVFRVENKIDALENLSGDLLEKIESKLKKLQIDLDNSRFVRTHNLSKDLRSFDDLSYQLHPNRTVPQHYTDQVCHTELRGVYDTRVRVCRDVRRTRQVPDEAFHSARDRHKSLITRQINSLKKDIVSYGHLQAAKTSLEVYLDRISETNYIRSLNEDPVMYFNEFDPAENTKSLDFKNLPEVNEEDINDYIDGCNGHCEDIAGKIIQSDIKSFRTFDC